MAEAAIAILWLALGAAPEAAFPEIWYRETILGDLEGAAAAYEAAYLGASSDPDLARQVKAAFKAGECFERLGKRSNAVLAYSFLRKRASEANLLSPEVRAHSSEAALRLFLLRERYPELALDATTRAVMEAAIGSDGTARADASANLAIRQLLGALKERAAKLNEALVTLDSELSYRRERYAERSELLSRLARRGAFLAFQEEPSSVGTYVGGALSKALSPWPEGARVPAELGERAFRRALRYLAVSNVELARAELQVVRALLPETATVREWARLSRSASSAGAVQELALRQSVDLDLTQRSQVRREIREALETAEALVSERGRADLAVRQLAKVLETLDWTPPDIREEAEIRDLAERAVRWLDQIARSCGLGEGLEQALRSNRTQLEDLLKLSGELVSVLLRQASLEGPALEPLGAETQEGCRLELESLIYKSRESSARGDRLEAQRWVRDALALLDWVPAIDPRSDYRAAIDALRRGEKESAKEGG